MPSPLVPLAKCNDQHDYSFFDFLQCDATWTSEVYDNLEEYVDGKTRALTTGFGIELGMAVNGDVNLPRDGGDLGFNIPPVFSRSWSNNKDRESVVKFYVKEGGSIAVTEALCLTHKVDISDLSTKYFVQPFIDSVVALSKVVCWQAFECLFDEHTFCFTQVSKDRREDEMRRFINEFGTHYSSTSELGTKLTIERRYTASERSSVDDNQLKDCNTKAGLKIIGLQAEIDKVKCASNDLLKNDLESKNVERTVISTYGSFIAKSLADWSKQVVSLVQGGSFR